MPYDVRAVANYFLDRADEAGQELDHMKLQKLVYIAHGWHLAITGEPLIYERAEAWPYGPVIPDLYHALKHHGRRPIREKLSDVDLSSFRSVPASLFQDGTPVLTATEEVLNKVWERYGSMTALQLSALTHQVGSPWDRIARQSKTSAPRRVVIPDDLVREHYRNLAAARRAARAQ